MRTGIPWTIPEKQQSLNRVPRQSVAPSANLAPASCTSSRGQPTDPADLKNPALYVNRELSWLEFNERVLAQARDTSHPLLERVKFLAITGTNLDEFFMIRVATTLKKLREEIEDVAPDGFNTEQQLDAMRARRARMLSDQAATWESCGRSSRRNRSRSSTKRLDTGRARAPERLFLARDLPRADTARLRSRTSVSAHLEFEQELRGRGPAWWPHEVRTGEGAGRSASIHPVTAGRRRGRRTRSYAFVEDVIRANIQELFTGTQVKGASPVPHHSRHGPGDQAGRSRRPARDPSIEPAGNSGTARSRCCRSKPTCRQRVLNDPGRELRDHRRGRRASHAGPHGTSATGCS